MGTDDDQIRPKPKFTNKTKDFKAAWKEAEAKDEAARTKKKEAADNKMKKDEKKESKKEKQAAEQPKDKPDIEAPTNNIEEKLSNLQDTLNQVIKHDLKNTLKDFASEIASEVKNAIKEAIKPLEIKDTEKPKQNRPLYSRIASQTSEQNNTENTAAEVNTQDIPVNIPNIYEVISKEELIKTINALINKVNYLQHKLSNYTQENTTIPKPTPPPSTSQLSK